MDVDAARLWLAKVALGILAAELVFFLLAPLLGYPLTYDEVLRLLEILIPVFLGYLGAATRFLLEAPDPHAIRVQPVGARGQLFGLMVRGPVIVWAVGTTAALVAFGASNAEHWGGARMTLDGLSIVNRPGFPGGSHL